MRIKVIITFILALLASACSNLQNIKTVENLDIEKYVGKYYEIARLPNPFEDGLGRIYAIYTLRANDEIEILNVGYNSKNEKKTAKASAYPLDGDFAKLRVTFFYPFYGDYAVTMLADDYSYAVVESPPYLWILARENHLPEDTLKKVLAFLNTKNIDTSKLIYVEH